MRRGCAFAGREQGASAGRTYRLVAGKLELGFGLAAYRWWRREGVVERLLKCLALECQCLRREPAGDGRQPPLCNLGPPLAHAATRAGLRALTRLQGSKLGRDRASRDERRDGCGVGRAGGDGTEGGIEGFRRRSSSRRWPREHNAAIWRLLRRSPRVGAAPARWCVQERRIEIVHANA